MATSAKAAAAAGFVTVSLAKVKHDSRPAHHANDSESLFVNPWESFDRNRSESMPANLYNIYKDWEKHPMPERDQMPKVVRPDWGRRASSTSQAEDSEYARDIKATWLGHACFLVELPSADPSKRGIRILFDPVFSHRCSPSQLVGPARYTPPPLSMKELPEIDAVILSHNHYDHTDTATLKHLYSSQRRGSLHFFAPLGLKKWFKSIGVSSEHCTEFDWWDSAQVSVSPGGGGGGGEETSPSTIRITCTPCQHFSGRGIFDRNHTLWASWAVEQQISPTSPSSTTPGGIESAEPLKKEGKVCKIWFGGDTAYRSVPRGMPIEEEHKLPYCPAFKEIGAKFGHFDLAMIPIGAYSPRYFMSRVHASPEDSVEIHLDIRSRKSVGMHYYAWQLTDEYIHEPPERLRKQVKAKGLQPDEFVALDAIGSTLRVTPSPSPSESKA